MTKINACYQLNEYNDNNYQNNYQSVNVQKFEIFSKNTELYGFYSILIEYYCPAKGYAYPSNPYLERTHNLSRYKITKYLKALSEAGIIIVYLCRNYKRKIVFKYPPVKVVSKEEIEAYKPPVRAKKLYPKRKTKRPLQVVNKQEVMEGGVKNSTNKESTLMSTNKLKTKGKYKNRSTDKNTFRTSIENKEGIIFTRYKEFEQLGQPAFLRWIINSPVYIKFFQKLFPKINVEKSLNNMRDYGTGYVEQDMISNFIRIYVWLNYERSKEPAKILKLPEKINKTFYRKSLVNKV